VQWVLLGVWGSYDTCDIPLLHMVMTVLSITITRATGASDTNMHLRFITSSSDRTV